MQFQISSRMENRKEIPEPSRLKFLQKFSANNFVLSDAENITSGSPNRGGIADFENTIGNLPKVQRAKFLGSDGLFYFISMCKFGSFKNTFAISTGEIPLNLE